MSAPPRPPVILDPAEPALPAVKRLLAEQFRALHRHAAALTADAEAESLHDFRVALRRSRTLFGRCREVVPSATVDRFHDPLRDMARQSGERRDLDVLLGGLDASVALPGSATLRAWLATRRQAAHEQFLALLAGDGSRLLAAWGEWLVSVDKAASPPLAPFARQQLALALRALRRGNVALPAAPSALRLHRLRILGKRVRYLIEFFSPLLPGGEWERLLALLKRLQDLLGQYQDGVCHLALLRPPPSAPVSLRHAARQERARVRCRRGAVLPAALAVLAELRQPWIDDLERALSPTVSSPVSVPFTPAHEVAMKQLTLIRHAKAKKTARRGDDRERPLRKRGMNDARALAELLPAFGWSDPLVLTSPARRAVETAGILFPATTGSAERLQVAGELYPGTVEELLALLRRTPNDCAHVVLVGHDPALTELWVRLSGEDCAKLPTCSCYSLIWAIDDWRELRPGGQVVLRHSPRQPALPPVAEVPASSSATPAGASVTAAKSSSRCRKGKSEAEAVPGNYRCRKCKAVSDRKTHVCAPEKIE